MIELRMTKEKMPILVVRKGRRTMMGAPRGGFRGLAVVDLGKVGSFLVVCGKMAARTRT